MIDCVTEAGIDLICDVLAGGGELEFTRFEVGSGAFDPETQEPRNMTALMSREASMGVTRVSDEDGGVAVTIDMDNDTLAAGTRISENGLFAKVGDREAMFLYGYTATPETIPPRSETFYDRRFVKHIAMSDEETAVVVKEADASLATALKAGYMSPEDKAKLDSLAVVDGKLKLTKEEVVEALGYTPVDAEKAAQLAAAGVSITFDDATGIVVTGGGTGGSWAGTVDAALSETSTNPVQNRVITSELGKKVSEGSASIALTEDDIAGLYE